MVVIPAKAGIQRSVRVSWTPAFAGVTLSQQHWWASLRVVPHHSPSRESFSLASRAGGTVAPLPADLASFAPPGPFDLEALTNPILVIEARFGSPQEDDWPMVDGAVKSSQVGDGVTSR